MNTKMNEQTNTRFPYSFTMPLNQEQEVEVFMRVKERGKEVNWGEELMQLFTPTRQKAKRYSLKKINQDIDEVIENIRSHAPRYI